MAMKHMMKKGRTPSEDLGSSEHEGKYWGKGQMANMPQDVMMKHFKKASEYGSSDLDDTMDHIDEVNSMAERVSRSHVSRQH